MGDPDLLLLLLLPLPLPRLLLEQGLLQVKLLVLHCVRVLRNATPACS